MTDNLRGIIAILISAVAFVTNDALMKLAATALPAGETLFLRGLGASALLLGYAGFKREAFPMAVMLHPVFLLRCASAAASAVLIILSLQRLPLASVSAVIQVTPLAVMAGAGLLFGEQVGMARWLAALTGFAGVLLVISPWKSGTTMVALLPLAALTATVVRDLCTRGIARGVSALLISTISTIFAMVGGALLGLSEAWQWPDGGTWLLVGACSVLIVVAYTAGVIAMRTGDIAAVVPFRYAQIPLTLAFGYAIWGHLPDRLAWLGIGLILAAGLFAITLERRARLASTAGAR